MCFIEFIAYQCGHPTASVLRPCPVTTAGHNFPVCSTAPYKQYFAETMCTVCERTLHSRWVLIRECEHRWLHIRGACGCEVSFPGILYTPRAIGGETAPSGPSHPAASSRETDNASVSVAGTPIEAEPININKAASTTSESEARIPAIFSEAITSSGDRHIAIRLPGLYAAEWRDDHRAQHEAGHCTCPIDPAPYEPEVPHSELTAAEREKVREWEQEVDKQQEEASIAQATDNEADDDTKRVAEITRLFGSFNPSETPTASSTHASAAPVVVRSEVVVGAPAAGRQGYPVQGQINNNNNNHPGGYSVWLNIQQNTMPHLTPATAYGPPTSVLAQKGYNAQPYAPAHINPPSMPGYPHHQGQPNPSLPYGPYNPAYPTYATHATCTDTMPQSAYNWGPPRRVPNMPGMTQGPGPYRTPGIIFTNPPSVAIPPPRQQHSHPHQAHHAREHVLPRQDQHAYHPQQHHAALTEPPREPPHLGLPIGAGPEGTSHMPPWEHCGLRSLRGLSTAASVKDDGDDVDEDKIENEDSEGQVEADDGKADNTGNNSDDEVICAKPPPLPRRHSAAT